MLFRDVSFVVILVVTLASTWPAQTPASGQSARNIPTAQDGIDNQILKLINKSEEHFKHGLLNLQNRNQDGAREDFDKAMDVIYESGYDIRTNERLHRYFWDLVERIYRLRDSKSAQQIAANYGVSDAGGLEELSQEYEPGNLEELAKLEFTQEEQKVTVPATAKTGQAKTRPQETTLAGPPPRQLPDGRVPVVIQYLQDNLHDPYSMKLLKWSKVEKRPLNGELFWFVELRYRAKNTFGAYVLAVEGFYIRNNKVVSISK
jgi:hypothetical protein